LKVFICVYTFFVFNTFIFSLLTAPVARNLRVFFAPGYVLILML
jgi:hypothetical protein